MAECHLFTLELSSVVFNSQLQHEASSAEMFKYMKALILWILELFTSHFLIVVQSSESE